MKNKFLILILFSSLFSCDFICPPEEGRREDKTSDSTQVQIIKPEDEHH